MTRQCCAYNCRNRSSHKIRETGVTFHKFPVKNKYLRKIWIRNCRWADWEPSKYTFVCSDHFEKRCFVSFGGTKRLQPTACPTIFNYPESITKSIRRKRGRRSLTKVGPGVWQRVEKGYGAALLGEEEKDGRRLEIGQGLGVGPDGLFLTGHSEDWGHVGHDYAGLLKPTSSQVQQFGLKKCYVKLREMPIVNIFCDGHLKRVVKGYPGAGFLPDPKPNAPAPIFNPFYESPMQRYNRIKNEKSLVEVQKGIIAIKLQHSKAYVAADHNYCLPPAKDLQRRVSVLIDLVQSKMRQLQLAKGALSRMKRRQALQSYRNRKRSETLAQKAQQRINSVRHPVPVLNLDNLMSQAKKELKEKLDQEQRAKDEEKRKSRPKLFARKTQTRHWDVYGKNRGNQEESDDSCEEVVGYEELMERRRDKKREKWEREKALKRKRNNLYASRKRKRLREAGRQPEDKDASETADASVNTPSSKDALIPLEVSGNEIETDAPYKQMLTTADTDIPSAEELFRAME